MKDLFAFKAPTDTYEIRFLDVDVEDPDLTDRGRVLSGFILLYSRPAAAKLRKALGGAGGNTTEANRAFLLDAVTSWRGMTAEVFGELFAAELPDGHMDAVRAEVGDAEIEFSASRWARVLDAWVTNIDTLAARMWTALQTRRAVEVDQGNV